MEVAVQKENGTRRSKERDVPETQLFAEAKHMGERSRNCFVVGEGKFLGFCHQD